MARGGRRRQQTRYGVQLEEKRNLKKIFGVRERQLRNYFKEALASREHETGNYLIELLERRLDNALLRSGMAESRPQARQMSSHKLMQVNGRTVSVPSMRLKEGDVVQVKESKRGKSYFSSYEKRMQNAQVASWIELDTKNFSFKVIGSPSAEEAKLAVDTQAVVELLAR